MAGDELYDSQGVALDESFTFEMGIFANGFVPTASNLNDWSSNWLVFDAAVADNGWNVPFQYVAVSADLLPTGESSSPFASAGVFPQNAQAYLWVYNSKSVAFTSEWALVSDFSAVGNISNRWIFPSPPIPDQITPEPFTWSFADADTAIVGALHSGAAEGGGLVSSQPSSFTLQTYQIPEPGSALLIGAAGLLVLVRRRRFRN